MRRTNIYLTEAQCDQLDERARVDGVSRALLIRSILDRALCGEQDRLASDLDAIAESFGAFAGDRAVPSRADGDRATHLARIGAL
jgi:hypothetical protein